MVGAGLSHNFHIPSYIIIFIIISTYIIPSIEGISIIVAFKR